MTSIFQLPIGPWPYPAGTRLRSRSRPWWGVGIVESVGGKFAIAFRDPLGTYRWWYDSTTAWDELDVEVVADAE